MTLDYLRALRDGYESLLREAQSGLLPWAHAIKVTRLIWEPECLTSERWDAVAATVRDLCVSAPKM